MKIIFRKKFIKNYTKLPLSDRKNIDATINLFELNPHDKKLRNHSLSGEMHGLRSISAGFDLRIIFQEFKDYTVVVMIRLGSHNQVY